MPRDKIVSSERLHGYSMEYIRGKSIFELNLNKKQLIDLFRKISSYLKYYHKYGIVLADFNLSNILFTSKSDFHFVDVDSARIYDLPHDSIPAITYNFLTSHGCDASKVAIDENFDNLSLILNFLYVLFEGHPIYNLSQYEIDEYLEKKEIEEQKPFVKALFHSHGDAPYFDQVFR